MRDPADVRVSPLQKTDLPEADRIFRLAFGTFLGLPDPMSFAATTDYIGTRWAAGPAAVLAAKLNDQLIGSVFAASWGSFGFFGPLTVRPDYWDKGIAQLLLERTMALFGEWKIKHAGLFTFAQSAKHIALYQKFGFWPQYLTSVMSKTATPRHDERTQHQFFSGLREDEKGECLRDCRALTNAIFDDLNLEREIIAVDKQHLGETLLLRDDAGLAAFAVCHCGAGTEGGAGVCYVKFGAVRPGPRASETFDLLLLECEKLAAQKNLSKLSAGVNLARHLAYAQMLKAGFRTDIQGVAMQRPNEPGFNRPDVFVMDDWR